MKNKIERDIKLTHDCAGEFTLPDYLPAIGKMLIAECSVAPDDVYLRENGSGGVTAELGGDVIFRVVWAAEGSEDIPKGTPAAATFSCDYDTAAVLGAVSVPRCNVTTTPEGVFCRVTGPRKLSLRARLSSRVVALTGCEREIPAACRADGVEVLAENTAAAGFVTGSARDLFASFELPSSGGLFCRAAVNVTSCTLSSPTECRVDGDVMLTCYNAADGGIMPSVAMVPFSETVALDTNVGVAADAVVGCRAFGTVTSEEMRSEGDGGTAEIMYDLFVHVLTVNGEDEIRDAYSCRGNSVCTYESVEYLSPLAAVMGSVTVNERTETSATGKVEIMSAAATVDEAVTERGKLRLTGKLTGAALVNRDGEYETAPWSVPWWYETALPASTAADADKTEVWGEAKVLSTTGRADGALFVTAELAVSATAVEPKRTTVVSELAVSDGGAAYCGAGKGGIRVYYPLADEGVWDVAKRFRVPKDSVDVPENVDEGGKLRRVVVI